MPRLDRVEVRADLADRVGGRQRVADPAVLAEQLASLLLAGGQLDPADLAAGVGSGCRSAASSGSAIPNRSRTNANITADGPVCPPLVANPSAGRRPCRRDGDEEQPDREDDPEGDKETDGEHCERHLIVRAMRRWAQVTRAGGRLAERLSSAPGREAHHRRRDGAEVLGLRPCACRSRLAPAGRGRRCSASPRRTCSSSIEKSLMSARI